MATIRMANKQGLLNVLALKTIYQENFIELIAVHNDECGLTLRAYTHSYTIDITSRHLALQVMSQQCRKAA